MTNALPTFSFKKATADDIELDQALAAQVTSSKFFKPGTHEVSILTSTYTGLASDPSWGKVRVEYEGAGGKKIKDTIMIPFNDIQKFTTKTGKNSLMPGRKLKMFLNALGDTVKLATLEDTLKQRFGADNSLAGLPIVIETGYTGSYLKGQRQGDTLVVTLVYRDGNAIPGHKTFDSYDAANEYVEQHNIEVQSFVDVLVYKKSAALKAPKDSSNW